MESSTIPQRSPEAPQSPLQPTYAGAFRCIGPACEDPCCGEWDIPVDRSTYHLYQRFPPEKLGSLVSQFVSLNPPPQPDPLYARINRSTSGSCPFFGPDHLCAIQKLYGPRLLSATCSIYPRSLSIVAGELEGALSLSCPEAARNVLLDPYFMHQSADLRAGSFRTDNVYHLATRNLSVQPADFSPANEDLFLEVRSATLAFLRDRSQPVWSRLLNIGRFCQHLESARLSSSQQLSQIIKAHHNPQNQQLLHAELTQRKYQPELRLEAIFALTDNLLRTGSGRRLQDVFWTFVEGIATPLEAYSGPPLATDLARFQHAEHAFYESFFRAHPFILENYLANYISLHLFPFGRTGSDSFVSQGIFAQFLRMTTLFAWINGLLIGIAAKHKLAFSGDHVIDVVQSVTRSIEHYPDSLAAMDDYIACRQWNNLHGMAILLRG